MTRTVRTLCSNGLRGLIAWLVLSAGHAGAAPSLLGYELKSLDKPATEALERYRGKPLLMLFFQPECNWCLKQVRLLNRLPDQCRASFHAVAIGVNGDRSSLKRELIRLRPEFPAYQASPALIEDIGGVPATPFALLADADGEFLSWMRGYMPKDRLLQSLAPLDTSCQSQSEMATNG